MAIQAEEPTMPIWQRMLITLALIVAASWLVTLLLEAMLGVRLPAYIAGVIGGITGVPVWELLRRVQAKPKL